MKKILLLAIIGWTLIQPSPAVSQDEATKPGYRNGESWLFTSKDSGTIGSDPSKMLNGTYELSIVGGKFKIEEVTGSQKDELDPRPPTLSCLLAYCLNLNFPLTAGKQWTRDYKGTYIGSNRPMARKVAREVKGIEQVTTAAGTFRAFKLESDDRAGPRDYWTTTYWYSPETKSIVKYQFDATAGGQEAGLKRHIELIKFTPVK